MTAPSSSERHRWQGSHWTRYGRPKVTFLTEAAAQARADQRHGMQPYRCAECGLWHIGHPREGAA